MVPWTVQSYQLRLVVLYDGPIKTKDSLNSSKLSAMTDRPLWWFHHNQWFPEQFKVISYDWSSSMMVLLKPKIPWTVQSYPPRLVVLYDGSIIINGSLNSSKISAWTDRTLWWFHHNQWFPAHLMVIIHAEVVIIHDDSTISNGSLVLCTIIVVGHPLW
jgi:hypothetical protein